jgi:hypothetical protein
MRMPASLIVTALFSMQIMAGAERQQFSHCLRSFVDKKLEERASVEGFEADLATACLQQETAYRAAYIAAAVRAGDSRTMAERDAATEVQDLRFNFVEIFIAGQPG